MAKFEISTPEQISGDPLAIKFLEDGASGFGGILSVKKALDEYIIGQSLFVTVKEDESTIGAIYLTFTQQEVGKVMSSILLGGYKFSSWADQLSDFYYRLAQDNKCDEFMLMGRKGFKKYFPELCEVATVFRVKLTNVND